MTIKLETIERIKKLRGESMKFASFWANYRKATDAASCDKYEASFTSNDDRFNSFKVSASFTSLTGYYGNSSCSTFMAADSKFIEPYFRKALDALAPQLFSQMARIMDEEAASLKEAAEKEVAALQKLVAELAGA